MLTIRGLKVGYSGSLALGGVDLEVPAGELAAVIGPNGAGKSTLLRCLSGLLRPQRGEIEFDGHRIDRLSPDRIVARGLVHVPEGRMVLGQMTVRDNLLLGGFCRHDAAGIRQDLDEILTMFPKLQELLQKPAGLLSGGEQQMLAIGRGMMARPRLLMLDEPSLGLAPMVIARIFELMGELRARGLTILLVEQNAGKALKVADRGYVLDLGRVVASGAAADLASDPRVRSAYLGV